MSKRKYNDGTHSHGQNCARRGHSAAECTCYVAKLPDAPSPLDGSDDQIEARIVKLTDAADALLLAYAKNDDGGDSIDWQDLDDAFALAKRALPGRYRALVKQLAKENA